MPKKVKPGNLPLGLAGLLWATGGITLPASLRAQTPPLGERGTSFIARLDRDGDGRVSAAEFDGPPQHFATLDENGDGFLDASEAPSGPPPSREGGSLARGGRRPPPEGANRGQGPRAPLTLGELAARFLARLDQDGDGRVSAQEFDGPPAHFAILDKNGDGFLDSSEAPAPACPCPPRTDGPRDPDGG